MTNLPQRNVNSIQFGKEIVHVNHIFIPGSPILKEKGLEDCSFSVDHKRTLYYETSELRNSLELPQKFLEIFGNSRIIVGNSGTRQEKISCLWLRKSWQVYESSSKRIRPLVSMFIQGMICLCFTGSGSQLYSSLTHYVVPDCQVCTENAFRKIIN